MLIMDNQLRHQYLQAMGIQVWERRDLSQTEPAEALSAAHTVKEPEAQWRAPVEHAIPSDDVALLNWQQLQARVAVCEKCELHKTRTQTVFGVGNQQADWLIIGEAPGADEDRQGEPFVGRAGQLLNAMIAALGMKREQVYIANILKCRPPDNRDPRAEEVVQCEPYLKRQITLLQPKIILAVGRIAAQNLLKTEDRIGLLRGKKFTYADTGIPLVATYHPAYLLRSPKEKRKAWEDLKLAYRIVNKDS